MRNTQFAELLEDLKSELDKLASHEYAIKHGVTRQEILAYTIRKLSEPEHETAQQRRHLRLVKNDNKLH